MRLKVIISGLVIGGAGFAAYYYNFLKDLSILGVPVTYGIMGIGVILILAGLMMRKRI